MKLGPGEIKCDKCDGYGNFGYDMEIQEIQMGGIVHRIPGPQTPKTCSKCFGSGKLDWIEKIVGKRTPNMIVTKTIINPKTRMLENTWTMETVEDLTALYSEDLINGLTPR